MQIALMETCMIYVREWCHAPGRQQDGTTDEVTETCAPKNYLKMTSIEIAFRKKVPGVVHHRRRTQTDVFIF
jgi:hypothetical protein